MAAALTAPAAEVVCAPVDERQPEPVDAIALLHEELSSAGEHAEGLIDAAVAALRPGGWLVVSAHASLTAAPDAGRTYRSDELRRALGHHGVEGEVLAAPGAGALVRGDSAGPFDEATDRLPGLLDAAPRLFAAGRTAASAGGRTAAFFATLPYKVVAASVVCRDSDGRLLVVHDSFKGHWTLPGGVVDADEDPRSAAEREAWEEAGVRVRAGTVAGVFSASWPDRVVLVYEAVAVDGADHRHTPVHAHEIDAVAWLPLAEALERLAPHIAEQVRSCIDHPGQTLRQGKA